MKRIRYTALLFSALLLTSVLSAQNGVQTRITLHGKSLENTVTKENPDREISIYLPPGYETAVSKRYPTIYLLHGIADTDLTWTSGWNQPDSNTKIPFTTIAELMDEGIRRGKFGEMIVVMPNQKTNWFGSFYVNSAVTGNWEDFTVNELVSYVDKNYRTIAKAESRGIGGHSMGGYGALTIGMKNPDVFSVVYGMNPAIIDWAADLTIATPAFRFLESAKSFDEVLKTGDFYNIGLITVGQAFSPNPNRPPFYYDSPYKTVDGKLVPSEPAFSKWKARSPITMVTQHRGNLKKLRGLKLDSGYEDEFRFIPPNARAFSTELTNNGIDHTFEEYNGDHRDRINGKYGRIISDVLPFFWDHLETGNDK